MLYHKWSVCEFRAIFIYIAYYFDLCKTQNINIILETSAESKKIRLLNELLSVKMTRCTRLDEQLVLLEKDCMAVVINDDLCYYAI